jgi:tetratricopeptide (TPR) repeat protein
MATARPIHEHQAANWPACVTIVESPAGRACRRWLEHRHRQTPSHDVKVFRVSCAFDSGGPWAGVSEFFSALLPEIQARRPDLIEKHALELIYVLPRLRRLVTVRNPSLTDLAPREEKTRNYPADRAFRTVHGLIDLLDAWKTETCAEAEWVLTCDGYDEAAAMSARFFRELMRRRGERLRIRALLGVKPGQGNAVRESFRATSTVEVAPGELDDKPATVVDSRVAAQRARELEETIGDDQLEAQVNLPDLILLWGLAGRPDKVLRYKSLGLGIYNTLGLYEDALRYGEGILDLARQHAPEDETLQWMTLFKLLMCHMGLQDVKTSLALAEDVGLNLVKHRSDWRVRLFYIMAMFYGRYMKPRDLQKGEEFLNRALEALEQANLPEGEYHFHYCFNRNGLAMIRNFQGRHQEAIELCRSGLERLNQHLSADQHRLHRSVLFYNIAQVYSAIGIYDDAIQYYSVAISMDPNYSEYYNERGNLYLQLGRLEEARGNYLKAIELSPPYFEVFTNLGQCYRRMGEMEKAIESYSRALDLEPTHLLAILGRAKAHEELGHGEAAIQDYGAALDRDPMQWEAIASRGVIRYELGDLNGSLSDFDRAIELKSSQADLHQNRATVLVDLGRYGEAARDLETALALAPTQEDRKEVEARLATVRSSA